MKEGKIIIFSAPSGSGKTTIVRELMNDESLKLQFSISATNRAPRGTEKDGIDYYFLSTEAFKEKIEANKFIEWEEVYENRYYGTLKSEVERIIKNGGNAVFDIDVKGGLNLKEIFKQSACAVFIQPPSIETLEERLRNRQTEDKEAINMRLERADYELSFANQFDQIVINDDLSVAVDRTREILINFLMK